MACLIGVLAAATGACSDGSANTHSAARVGPGTPFAPAATPVMPASTGVPPADKLATAYFEVLAWPTSIAATRRSVRWTATAVAAERTLQPASATLSTGEIGGIDASAVLEANMYHYRHVVEEWLDPDIPVRHDPTVNRCVFTVSDAFVALPTVTQRLIGQQLARVCRDVSVVTGSCATTSRYVDVRSTFADGSGAVLLEEREVHHIPQHRGCLWPTATPGGS